MNISVTKRDGRREDVNLDKIHRVVQWACKGLEGVSASEIELKARLQFADGIRTKDIHETLIKSAADLISIESPDYQFVAARLVNYQLRKEVYGDFEPWPLQELIQRNVGLGRYTAELLTNYSPKEWAELDRYIQHGRDNLIAFAGMEQWRGKYLVKNRVTGEFYETPQIAYMLIAAIGFMNYPKSYRLEFVKHFYDELSLLRISLPTPIMAGLRTPVKQFSSCVTIAVGDSLESIKYAGNAVIDYISRKAGIGMDLGRIRGIKAQIRGGDAEHTGLIPIVRKYQGDVKSFSQGGVRGGAATLHFPFWHYEFEDLVVLKNNKGTENNRVRHLDYCFTLNKFMYQRLLEGGIISFFSPDEVPGLFEAYAQDQELFAELYRKYEADPSIRRRTMPALEAFALLHREAYETGRIYFMNIDHANDHGSFISYEAMITQSNLCQEITLPTFPFEEEATDEAGLISLCTLAAGNWTKVDSPEQLEVSASLIVRFLDALLDYQDYPNENARRATERFRPLGIGIVDLAHFLAINRVGYDSSSYELLDTWMEAWSYYLIKASIDLAEELGPCPGYMQTKYGHGIFPVHTYKKDVDSLVSHLPQYDWDALAERAKKVGIRNGTLMAQMPAETSAQANNSTNGADPVISLITSKVSKDGVLKFVVPGIKEHGRYYDLWWDHESPRGYLGAMAILQKWMDQAISINFVYNPALFPDGKVSMQTMIEDTLFSYKMGNKTRYYTKTNDQQQEEVIEAPLLDDVEDEEDCDACKL